MHSSAPAAPECWESSLRQLVQASKSQAPEPSWWNKHVGLYGTVETRLARTEHWWDGMNRLGKADSPFCFFQFTLAGWGTFERYEEDPQRMAPGMGFFAVVPSRHRYYPVKESIGP